MATFKYKGTEITCDPDQVDLIRKITHESASKSYSHGLRVISPRNTVTHLLGAVHDFFPGWTARPLNGDWLDVRKENVGYYTFEEIKSWS